MVTRDQEMLGPMLLLVSRLHRSVTLCTGTGTGTAGGIVAIESAAAVGAAIGPAAVCSASADDALLNAGDGVVADSVVAAVAVVAGGAGLLVTVSGEYWIRMSYQQCDGSCYHRKSDTAMVQAARGTKKKKCGSSLDVRRMRKRLEHAVAVVAAEAVVVVVPES